MSRKEELKKIMYDARDELSKIESNDRIRKNKQYIGKYFRYRNNYSLPEKPSDYWWIYQFVSNCDEHGFMFGWQFEKDKNEDIKIELNTMFYDSSIGEEISYDEFKLAWDRLRARLNSVAFTNGDN